MNQSATKKRILPMPVFENADQLYACIGGLFEKLKSHPETEETFKTLELTTQFRYTEPTALITLASRNGEQSIHYGECNIEPNVALAMTGDVAHQFWMGELNPMNAIMKRQIVIETGSLIQLMKLTDLTKVGIRNYPEHFKQFIAEQLPRRPASQ
jgi:putative sterol carrier protein